MHFEGKEHEQKQSTKREREPWRHQTNGTDGSKGGRMGRNEDIKNKSFMKRRKKNCKLFRSFYLFSFPSVAIVHTNTQCAPYSYLGAKSAYVAFSRAHEHRDQ